MSLYRPIPPLTLAANVEAPLSPTTWRDYGKLLYWIFFFPQAIRDYVTPKPVPAATTTTADRSADDQPAVDPAEAKAAAEQAAQTAAQQKQASLVRISAILLPILAVLLALLSAAGQRWLGDLDWRALVRSGIGSVLLGLLLAGTVFLVNHLQKRPAHSIVLGVATGLITTLISMFTLGEFFDDHFLGMGRALGYGFLSGSGVGILRNLATTLAPDSKAQPSLRPGLVGALVSGIVIFVINGFHASDGFFALNINQENWLAVVSGMVAFFGGAQAGQRRPLDWLLGKLFLNFQLRNVATSQLDRQLIKGAHIGNSYAPALEALFAPVASARLPVQPRFPHVTRYPIRQLTDHLATWLEYNWEQGLDTAEQFWRYTNQQPLVTAAIHEVLDAAQPDKQVEQVAQYVDKFKGQQWEMILYPGSPKPAPKATKLLSAAEVAKQRRQEFQRRTIWREFVTPTPYTMTSITLPMETVPQRAVAGFLYLTNYHLDKSVNVFQELPSSDFVKEMQGITQSVEKLLNTKNLITSPTVELPERPKEPKRKATWDALDKFKTLVRYGWLYHQCKDEERHEAARDMALYQLREVEKDAEKIPSGDRAMILRLVNLWRREFDNWMIANRKPQRMKPVNPFIFLETLRDGKPFVGRDNELKEVKSIWARGVRQPLLLYGLPQSGKTAFIIKALYAQRESAFVVKFNVPTFNQNTNPIRSTLWAMCEALHTHTRYDLPRAMEFQANPFAATERMVKEICKGLKPVLVLVVDNFDALRIAPPKVAIENMEFMTGAVPIEKLLNFWAKLFDALGQITFVFVANSPDFPQCDFTPYLKRLHIGALSEKDVLKLLTTPVPEFIPLFAPSAVKHIYHLSGGQPYLVQLIAHGVVDRFNQTLDKDEKLEPVFLMEDIDDVVKSDAFQQFNQTYFTALFRELETLKPGSTTVLRAIAQDEDGISDAALDKALAGQPEWATVELILPFLASHHLIRQEQGEWLVVGELLRRAAQV